MPTPKTILICTVGGSHEPIVKAIRETRPEYVCFVCTGKDPGSGQPGSDIQITGTGNFIKAHKEDASPTLPSIPVQVGLRPEQYKVLQVPADDLDETIERIETEIQLLRATCPGCNIIADYTGGTKSMTAALVFAAIDQEVELQFVTGNRSNLEKIETGMESVTAANIAGMQLRWAMAPYLAAWERYAYDEAAIGLQRIRPPREDRLRHALFRARNLSSAFAAWDRFDHAEALRLLEPYGPVTGKDLGEHLGALKWLMEASDKTEPLKILDLWRNAERRAEQGRYDDGVSRLYRFLEWTAQWLLRSRCGIDTSDIPPDKAPPGLDLTPRRDGRIQAGLFAAWQLAAHHLEGNVLAFFTTQKAAMRGLLQARNSAILAHGSTPVTREAWQEFYNWQQDKLLPLIKEELLPLRIKRMPPQLPNRYLWGSGTDNI